MNILIAGSSGFIANHLILELSKNLNSHIYGFDLANSKNTNFICDVRNNINIDKLPNKIDLIINLAAIHREPGHDPKEYFDTNILGAENITQFAEKVKCNRIIFTSSISPYGIENKLKDENTIPCPNTPYGSSKLAAEKIHIAWQNRDIKKRIITIVRPGVVFGKGEGGNMSRLVKLIHKNFFFYMGNKDTRKAGTYVKELVNQILWVHNKQVKNQLPKITLFNATMWPNPSISDYVDTVEKVAGIKRFVPSVPYWFLMSFGFIFEFFFKAIGKQNPFSPVRLRKLVRSNLVKPSFLLKNKYKPIYTLMSALKDWKKEDPEVWS
jgi:nucleoside-diphosphate-sugar epimerase